MDIIQYNQINKYYNLLCASFYESRSESTECMSVLLIELCDYGYNVNETHQSVNQQMKILQAHSRTC